MEARRFQLVRRLMPGDQTVLPFSRARARPMRQKTVGDIQRLSSRLRSKGCVAEHTGLVSPSGAILSFPAAYTLLH